MVTFKVIFGLAKATSSQKLYSRICIGAELQILDNHIRVQSRIINGIASIIVLGAES